MLRYDSDSDNSSDSDSNSSDSSEYDFIKAAKQNAAKPSKLLVDEENEQKKQNYNNNVNKVIDDSNTVARELFSILPDANYSKGDKILSISGTLRLKKDVQVVDIISTKKAAADKNNEDRKDYEEDEDEEGIELAEVKKSDITLNKDQFAREKIKEVSRAQFQQEKEERIRRMMPNKNDRSKNNLRSLAFDISGNLEQERIQSQKTFANSRRKYGW